MCPYPAVVRDRIGRAVHYGTWPVQQHIGTMGVFYWEQEQGGNAGYHLSYIGTDNGVAFSGNAVRPTQRQRRGTESAMATSSSPAAWRTRCGSVVSANCYLGAANPTAASALEAQMPDYRFVAYTTGSMYLTTMDANCTWIAALSGRQRPVRVPSIRCVRSSPMPSVLDSVSGAATNSAKPGATEGQRLSGAVREPASWYLNWNYNTRSTPLHSGRQLYRRQHHKSIPYLGSYRNSVNGNESRFGNPDPALLGTEATIWTRRRNMTPLTTCSPHRQHGR